MNSRTKLTMRSGVRLANACLLLALTTGARAERPDSSAAKNAPAAPNEIVASAVGPAFTLEAPTIAKGGGVLPDGSVMIVGQAVIGTMSNGSLTMEVGFAAFLNTSAQPHTPLPEPGGIDKQRFVSFVVPVAGAGQQTALRVTLGTLYDPAAPFPVDPPDFSSHEGEVRYVTLLLDDMGAPVTTCLSSPSHLTYYRCATLGCDPDYADWAGLFGGDVVHLSGIAIVPDSSYSVAQLSASCAGNEDSCAAVSAELALTTARYGDVDSSGMVDVTDIVMTVDLVKDIAGAVWEYQCYVRSPDPQPQKDSVNVTDIVFHVDALKLAAYPLPMTGCP